MNRNVLGLREEDDPRFPRYGIPGIRCNGLEQNLRGCGFGFRIISVHGFGGKDHDDEGADKH